MCYCKRTQTLAGIKTHRSQAKKAGAVISRLSYVLFLSCLSVSRHQIVRVAIVVTLVYTYLTRGIED